MAWSVMAGGSALLIFTSEDTADAFAAADPYVTEGLVTDYEVKEWSTVVGTMFDLVGHNEVGGHDEPMPTEVHTST